MASDGDLGRCHERSPRVPFRSVPFRDVVLCAIERLLGGLLFALCALVSVRATAQVIENFDAKPAIVYAFEMDPSESIDISLRGLIGAGADPVLYLFRSEANGTYTQVAYADNGATGCALCPRVTHTNVLGATAQFVAVGVARTTTTSATADLFRGSTHAGAINIADDLEFGRNTVTYGALASDPGNSVFAIVKARSRDVNVPMTAGASLLLALQGSSTFFDLDISNWSGRSSRTVDAIQVSSWLVGVPQTVVETTAGITIDRARVGTVRLVSNDSATDADGDGLSNEVEALVQTCTGTVGSACQGDWNLTAHHFDVGSGPEGLEKIDKRLLSRERFGYHTDLTPPRSRVGDYRAVRDSQGPASFSAHDDLCAR